MARRQQAEAEAPEVQVEEADASPRTEFRGTPRTDFHVPFRGMLLAFKSGKPFTADAGMEAFLVQHGCPVAWEE